MSKVTPNKKSKSATNSRATSKKNTPVNTPTKAKKPVAKSASGTPTVKTLSKKPASKNSTPVKVNKKQEKDEIVPKERVEKAIEELKKFIKKQIDSSEKSQLLDEDEDLNNLLQLIVVNGESYTGTKKNFKLKLLNVNTSYFKVWKSASATEVKDFKTLLILKDSDVSKVTEDDLFDGLSKSDITIDKIICGNDLKTVYKSYESRRALINDYQLIMADDSIVTALPKLLGAKAYNKVETTPISIRTSSGKEFNKDTLINSIKKVYLNKLPMKLPRSNTANIHLGKYDWYNNNEQGLVENIGSVISQMISSYKIRSVFIKSNSSPVLPLYFNADVIGEAQAMAESSGYVERTSVNIDGVELQLSAFDRALMEISNPKEHKDIFQKNIAAVKRKSEASEETNEAKKAKK